MIVEATTLCDAAPKAIKQTYTRTMYRPLKAYLVLAVLLWQALAWAAPHVVKAQAEQLAHQVVHVQDVDHHHHADQSLHLSSNSDSTAHFHADDGFQPIGLTVLAAEAGFAALPNAPSHTILSEPPTVFLDGLLRPPSETA